MDVLRAGTLLAACCLVYVKAQAQSFDCNKASTAVEHAICDDKWLGNLDRDLAGALKDVLNAEPPQCQVLLADQRRWLAYRDKHCDDASTRTDCLSNLYRRRVQHLQSRLVAGAAAICHRLVDSHLIAGAGGKAPTDAVATKPRPAFEGADSLTSFGNAVEELPAWAKAQSPPFVIAPELMDALKDMDMGLIGHLNLLPGTNLYAITQEQGSAHCLFSQFFAVEAGHARPVKTPPLIEDEGGMSCEASRGYGRMDGMPAIIQSGPDFGPDMSSLTIVVVWDGNMIPSACAMTSQHSPEFGKATWLEPKEECDGPMCDALRAAALELVEAVQHNPRQAHEQLRSSLTPAQRVEFDAVVDQAVAKRRLVPEARQPTYWGPDEIAIDVPLFLPYVHEGQVYVASVGHATAYGNTFADWRVEFDAYGKGERVQFASFPVGMKKGRVEDVSVSTKLR